MGKKERKLTVKRFAELVMQNSIPGDGDQWMYVYPTEMRQQLAALIAPKTQDTASVSTSGIT